MRPTCLQRYGSSTATKVGQSYRKYNSYICILLPLSQVPQFSLITEDNMLSVHVCIIMLTHKAIILQVSSCTCFCQTEVIQSDHESGTGSFFLIDFVAFVINHSCI